MTDAPAFVQRRRRREAAQAQAQAEAQVLAVVPRVDALPPGWDGSPVLVRGQALQMKDPNHFWYASVRTPQVDGVFRAWLEGPARRLKCRGTQERPAHDVAERRREKAAAARQRADCVWRRALERLAESKPAEAWKLVFHLSPDTDVVRRQDDHLSAAGGSVLRLDVVDRFVGHGHRSGRALKQQGADSPNDQIDLEHDAGRVARDDEAPSHE